jgi:hypothetical protein
MPAHRKSIAAHELSGGAVAKNPKRFVEPQERAEAG